MKRATITLRQRLVNSIRLLTLPLLCIIVLTLGLNPAGAAAPDAILLSADFNSDANGFTYQDDAFGTSQPNYASGTRVTAGGYGSTGGLQVTLGGVDANAINGMSGGWQYTLNLAAAETGVRLSFRYRLDQTATYEFDEYTRMLIKVDGVQYGRGAKTYVDHIGGDGSSSEGNSSTYLPTTDWQQHQIYLGDLAAGNHIILLGGYNNKKDAADESTKVTIDDVIVTSGNAAPVVAAAETLAARVSINQFLAYNQGIAQFDDRCRFSGMGCSSTDYVTNYMNALAWVEGQLQGMGYTTVRHTFTSNGGGTNLYATKPGSVTPTQMYMVAGHLDGRGGGDAFDDDGSAVALVLEVARVLAGSDVTTDKSVRFIFWDKEEGGMYGSGAYASDNTAAGGRRALQGTLDEPTWLGLIQHDMILYDHGAGTRTTAQSAYADLDVEWRAGTAQEAASRALALKWAYANGAYAPDYPATAYDKSRSTDDWYFQPYIACISVRENRRDLTAGANAEWINPNYHTVNDVESSYARDDDGDGKRDDIELGYNAVRTTLGLVAELAGAHVGTSNQAPVANPQSVTTAEDMTKAITLTGSDPDGNPLTYSVVAQPGHGSLSGTAPALTYTPAANYNGADSFTFKANDGSVDSAPATVSITVTPVNDAPVANAQAAATNEDTAKAITLTGSDVDGNPLSYSVVTQPGHGTLTGTAPNLTYTPAANYSGADGFTFKVNDGTVDSAPATVSITVNPVNDAPVANAQAVTTNEDTAKTITLSGSDVDGNPLTYSVVTQPSHGSLSGGAPNLTYTPAANYNGADSFTFKVNDGSVDSAPAAVSLTVTPVNDAPVANAQSASTAQDTPAIITLTGSDVDGDPLTFSVATNPAHGTLTGTAPNLTYTPAANYNGPDSFTFTASDGQVASAPATVSIAVTHINQAPTANAQSLTTAEDTPVAVTLTGADSDGDPLTYLIVNAPAHGILTGTASNLTYTPSANYNGPDSFSFKVNDGLADSAPAAVDITIEAVNDAPVAVAQAVTTAEDAPVFITLSGTDADGEALTYVVVSGPANGVLSGTAPALTYTPNANYNGPDSFTFKVNDGTVDSTEATVSITVTPVNDLPVANSQSVTLQQDTQAAITLTGSDGDGDPLTYSVATNPAHGTLSGTMPNLTYTPAAGYSGPDTFTFVANDGQATSAPATVSIAVTAVNHAPVANAQAVTTNEDTAIGITLSGSDPDGNPLTYSVVTQPGHGSLSGAVPNLTYTPAANNNGADSFQFSVYDGALYSTPATVSITVNPVNDPPVAADDSATTDEDNPVSIPVRANDSDADDDYLTVTQVSDPPHGTTSTDGVDVIYTLDPDYVGADTMTYADDLFRGSSAPGYASGSLQATRGYSGAGASVYLGGLDDTIVQGMSGGWRSSFTLGSTQDVVLSFRYNLSIDSDYESDEYGQVLVSVDGVLVGAGGNDYVAQLIGDGNGGSDQTTGWQEFTVNLGALSSGSHELVIGAYNNKKTYNNEWTEALIDDVFVSAGSPPESIFEVNFDGGSDSFTYTISDGNGGSDTATVLVTMRPVNDAPVASPQSAATDEDTGLVIALSGFDVDGDPLAYSVTDNPAHGALSGTATNLTYTPAANYYGPDSFAFTVSDGQLTSAPATVSITVIAVNDAPVANAQSVTTPQDTAKAITLTGSDVDGNLLTYSIVTQPAHGTLSGTAPNLTYTPAAGYSGVDSFTFVANDGTVNSAPATVNITVNPAGLPSPWLTRDIGSVGIAGSASYASSIFTLKGSGADIWGTSDQFRFVYQTLNGNGTIVARVVSQTNPNGWAKAGVMIRETLNTNSRHVMAIVSPSNGVRMQYRSSTGGSSTDVNGGSGKAPVWVKLVRSGSTFTTYRSPDGVTWTQIASRSVTMAASVYVGLVVTSHTNSALGTATFTTNYPNP